MSAISKTPQPPYYAVIFTSVRTEDDDGYKAMSERMFETASRHAGFLGFETARQGLGISVSYWTSLEAIDSWKANAEHREAQRMVEKWYKSVRIRVCRVEKDYGY